MCRKNAPLRHTGSSKGDSPKRVTLILFLKIWFLYTCKEHSFSFQMLPKLYKSFKSYWWISGYLGEFHLHTTVSQQLQFKMPETVIKHHIWPLKVTFSNRIMPEAPDFDENRKSIFLTCRSKIVALRIVTEYQCDLFRVVGSQLLKADPNWVLFWWVPSSSHG